MEKPLWISHRGYCRHAMENTRESFRAALEHGFSALETDLRVMADGAIVLHHDADLKRLLNDPRCLSALTRQEIKSAGYPLLFLDEFLDEFGHCQLTFDIKPEQGESTIRALVEWTKRSGWWPRLWAQTRFLFWRREHELLMREYVSDCHVYAREGECWQAALAIKAGVPALGNIQRGRTYALTPRVAGIKLFVPEIVAAYHQRGARVTAYLPETEMDARLALAAKCDEILTNGLPVTGN